MLRGPALCSLDRPGAKWNFRTLPKPSTICGAAFGLLTVGGDDTRTKITLGAMRGSGVRGLLTYCSDYKCSNSTSISGDQWPDDVRLSDIETRCACKACG